MGSVRREASGPAARTGVIVSSNSNRDVKIVFMKIILALLVAVGIVASVWDYKSWRKEETRNFGQGPKLNVQDSMFNVQLTEVYQNEVFRLRYPEGWKIEEAVKFERTEKNLPDIVDEEVVRIGKLDREPDHPDTDITVLTSAGRQTAITKNGTVVIKIEGPDGGIVGEIAKSLVFF